MVLVWQDTLLYTAPSLKGAFILSFCEIRKDEENMKKIIKSTASVLLVVLCLFSLAACGNSADKTGLWETATYLKDTEFGEGAKTAKVQVKAGEQTVTFTINTDKDTVGAALLEHGLIAGDQGDFGLYVKVVNGITADYDVDKSYWGFFVDGEYATSGVDTTEIKEGATYSLEYTK